MQRIGYRIGWYVGQGIAYALYAFACLTGQRERLRRWVERA